MGIFDFLKTRSKETAVAPRPKTGPIECDISKTQVIANLLQNPKEHRDEKWQKSFLDNVLTASFAAGNPQVHTGPDGFPYFNLLIPEPYKPFESFCINNLKDSFLLANGIGVAINAQATGADWVFLMAIS